MKRFSVLQATFALVFCYLGFDLTMQFVHYPLWTLIGPAGFPAYQSASGARTVPLVAILALPALASSVMLLWLRPAGIPVWAVWIGIALQFVPLVSTALVELPLQGQLLTGGPVPSVVASLVSTDLMFRVLPIVLYALLLLWMMGAAFRSAASTA